MLSTARNFDVGRQQRCFVRNVFEQKNMQMIVRGRQKKIDDFSGFFGMKILFLLRKSRY